ncbi:hypothetical protein PG996_011173 [Apiospora saccharicola]|uniref:Hypervirulence associated protein TUDOR domain-containing protein n=1 Tax=Apiospora saccharicola TaxID=335842 RepID=A0ABR1UED8_9PEZI
MRSSTNNKNGGIDDSVSRPSSSRDWKGQYKLRDGWSKGKVAIEERHVGGNKTATRIMEEEGREIATSARPMLVEIPKGVGGRADHLIRGQVVEAADTGPQGFNPCYHGQALETLFSISSVTTKSISSHVLEHM